MSGKKVCIFDIDNTLTYAAKVSLNCGGKYCDTVAEFPEVVFIHSVNTDEDLTGVV